MHNSGTKKSFFHRVQTQLPRCHNPQVAVWGIANDKYYQAVAAVTGMSSEFKIDLIDPETCRPILLEAIEKDGQEI